MKYRNIKFPNIIATYIKYAKREGYVYLKDNKGLTWKVDSKIFEKHWEKI